MRTRAPTPAARGLLAALLALLVLGAVLALWLLAQPRPAPSTGTAAHAGSATCAACHPQQHAAWVQSQHRHATQSASPDSVLAPFQGETFTHQGVTSRFLQSKGRYTIETQGPDGRMQRYEVSHTLGITPLQQYLIPMPHGGLQAFTIAWDSRTAAQGGQRWFALQQDPDIRPGDALHWSGRLNNWNSQCADCHTTQFRKNYDADNRRYRSSWAELSVACEACHGPAGPHLQWAATAPTQRPAWAHSGFAAPTQAASAAQEGELCARCHSHRSQTSDDYRHGQPLLDTHEPTLLQSPWFWPDGQMRGEVFNHASFSQSRMAEHGVRCSNCHDPHSLQLRAPGKGVCLQCHATDRYDRPGHHHHRTESAGAQCSACHMPTHTYMGVDARHDHSLRVPRPDLSALNGTPNACTQCHTKQSAGWAARWALRWYPQLPQRQRALDDALHPADGTPTSAALYRVAEDTRHTAWVRASALRQATAGSAPLPQTVLALLHDSDPLLRKTAADALARAEPGLRAQALRPLLSDPVRGVRMAAARWLAGLPQTDWSAQERQAWNQALGEYRQAQRFNAERPESWNNLGTLYAEQGALAQAQTALEHALSLDPQWAPSTLNLADLMRQQGQEARAEALLRTLLQRDAGDADAWYALGLSLLRQQRRLEAQDALRQAWHLRPADDALARAYHAVHAQQGQTRVPPRSVGAESKSPAQPPR